MKQKMSEFRIDRNGYPWSSQNKMVWEIPQPSNGEPQCWLHSAEANLAIAYSDEDKLRLFLQAHFAACGYAHVFGSEFNVFVEPYVAWYRETVADCAGQIVAARRAVARDGRSGDGLPEQFLAA